MDELYKLCSKCKGMTLDYSKMLQQDKPELGEVVQAIFNKYQNDLVCTNTWYAMILDITGYIKSRGYGYTTELVGEDILVIDICTTSIVQLG